MQTPAPWSPAAGRWPEPRQIHPPKRNRWHTDCAPPRLPVDRYAEDLSSILELVNQMNQVDSSGVKPLANPLDATQRLRDDEVTEIDEREKFQQIAPDVEQGLYRVPRVIE